MNLSTQPYKGARDFYPEDKRIQKYMFAKLREVVESYGYQEYDAPIIEPLDIYKAKTGDEIVNEQLYNFEDRGGRQVALRPEMTPTVSRMVAARRQELAYPLRLYSIPNLWRYERPQAGRLREHWQLNVDLFGVQDLDGDLEIIQIADSVMKAFGATSEMYQIKVNSREAMQQLLAKHGFDPGASAKIIGAFDRLNKPSFHDYLSQNFDSQDQANLEKFIYHSSGDEILATEAGANLSKLINDLAKIGVKVEPDVSINRGFEYYNDIVFEVFDASPANNRSMFGGGRYDGLVGLFGVDPVPTVGFGMGDVTLQNFLVTHKLLPELPIETDIVAVLIGDIYNQAQDTLNKLRSSGVNVAVDSTKRRLDSQIKHAVKSGIRYALFIGETELSSGKFKLRDLEKGQEDELDLKAIINKFTKHP